MELEWRLNSQEHWLILQWTQDPHGSSVIPVSGGMIASSDPYGYQIYIWYTETHLVENTYTYNWKNAHIHINKHEMMPMEANLNQLRVISENGEQDIQGNPLQS